MDGLWHPGLGTIAPMRALETAHSALEVGRRITAVREALSQSPAEFARHTGLTPQALNNYEKGRNRISLDSAILVCRATGATLDWIYFGDPSGLPQRLMPNVGHSGRKPA